MKKQSFLAVFSTVLCISSCTNRLVDFTIISTKNVDLSRAAQFKKSDTRKEGKDLTHIILFIPIGRPNMKEAIDRAIESTKGAVALVDGVVYSKFFWIPSIYGQQSFIVEGSPLIDQSLALNEPLEKNTYTFLALDKNGKVKRQSPLSPEEYNKLKNKITKGAVMSHSRNSLEFAVK